MHFAKFSNVSYAWRGKMFSTLQTIIDFNMTVSSNSSRIHFHSYLRFFSIFFFLESCGFSKLQTQIFVCFLQSSLGASSLSIENQPAGQDSVYNKAGLSRMSARDRAADADRPVTTCC